MAKRPLKTELVVCIPMASILLGITPKDVRRLMFDKKLPCRFYKGKPVTSRAAVEKYVDHVFSSGGEDQIFCVEAPRRKLDITRIADTSLINLSAKQKINEFKKKQSAA